MLYKIHFSSSSLKLFTYFGWPLVYKLGLSKYFSPFDDKMTVKINKEKICGPFKFSEIFSLENYSYCDRIKLLHDDEMNV